MAELGTVQKHGGHGHHLARFDLVLKQGPVDHGGADAGVLHRHQVQGLNHVRAAVTRQRDVDFKVKVAVQRADLLNHFGLDFRRVAANLQQCQDQRGEFVAHGQASEPRTVVFTRPVDGKRRLAQVVATAFGHGDQS